MSSGTYYFCVVKDDSTGNYSFKLSSSTSGGTTPSSGKVDLLVSKSSVTIKKGETATVKCSYTGSNSNGVTISYSIDDKSVATCSWGSRSENQIPVTIKGEGEGKTKIKISLKDSSTKEVLDYEYITVTVNSDDNGDSGNDDYSTGFFLFDIVFFIIDLVFSLLFFWF